MGNLLEGYDSNAIAAFRAFHERHPDVWKRFKEIAFELRQSGIKHYGAKGIMEVIRHERTRAAGIEFKVNNNFTALYARSLAKKHPEFSEFFQFRKAKGLSRPEFNKADLEMGIGE